MKMTVVRKMILLIVTAILGLVGLVWLGQNRMEAVYEKTNLANVSSIPSIVIVNKAANLFGHLRVRPYRHVLNTDTAEMTKIEAGIKEGREAVVNALKEYEVLISDDKDKQLLAEDRAAFDEYFNGVEKALDLSRQNKKEQARDFLVQARPLDQKAYAAFEAHMEYNIGLAKKGADLAAVAKADANLMSTLIGIIVLMFTVLIGWFITINLMRQLGGEPDLVADLANKIAAGDLSTLIDLKAGNPNSVMSAMKRMTVSIQALVTDVSVLSTAAIEGHLAMRADAVKHQGDFRNVVEGVNQTMDSLVGYLDSMPIPAMIIDTEFNIRYMNKIGAELGNTAQEKLCGQKCSGYFKTEDCHTSKCACDRAMKSGVVNDSQTVARPGQLELDIKYIGMPVKNRQGDIIGAFEVIIDQTEIKKAQRVANKIAGYQEKEAAKVQSALAKISQGDLEVRVEVAESDQDTQKAHETFAVIGDATNKVIESVRNLVTDTDLLYAAAVAGRLEIRADLSKHQGDYRKVVEGVNNILDSIILPVSEVVAVLAEMEKGDFTRTVNGGYKGQLNDFKNTVNNTIAKLSQVINEVNGAAANIASASEEVASTAQSLSQATTEQAAGVEETSASIEQMSASISQNNENAKVTDGMATQVSSEAVQGGAAVKETAKAMKSIAGKIGIIDDIAYQTNLLALNAAIEAARAGEHGRGFAVVAAEVRKLAERSQIAAQEIGELAASSVEMAESAGKLLDTIVPSIKLTSDLVQEISAASEEQSAGAGQINSAMDQLNQITQQNAGSAEELASTSEEMSGQAEQLLELMAFFTVSNSANKVSPASRVKPLNATVKKMPAAKQVAHEAEFVKF
ncbi:MAG: methyl-accepting chemotaxis protein [Methylococcaceae bacterium]